eukprot:4610312-Amphidinium_carterae.2
MLFQSSSFSLFLAAAAMLAQSSNAASQRIQEAYPTIICWQSFACRISSQFSRYDMQSLAVNNQNAQLPPLKVKLE